MQNDGAVAGHLDLREDVRRNQHCVVTSQSPDQFAHGANLIWVEAGGRFVEYDQLRLGQEGVSHTHALPVTA